ncbi:MAG: GNAT family N-acetyltransferase [Elusimicrobiales bacterium]|nr:GNAT family N-acetyltransferase [Elusimicrobiales bacterium]
MIRLEPLAPTETPPPGGAYSCSPAWANLCRGLYSYDLREYRLVRGAEILGGFSCAVVRSSLFGTRLISLPFSDEPGLWLRPGAAVSAQELAALRGAVAGVLDGLAAETAADYAELRGADALFPQEEPGFVSAAPYLRLVLDTSRPYEDLRKNFHSNLIKNLRKAGKSVAVQESRDPAAFAAVYPIYLRQLRRFGSPPLPAAHFEALLRAGMGRLYTASVGGRPAAFLFALVWDKTFYADVNAGLPEYETWFPKIRLFDETIRLACREGLRAYDFMRTRAGSGVHEHKKKWGGSELPIKYYYRVYKKGKELRLDPEQARFALPRLLLRRAPLALLKAVGPLLRRHAGK